MGDHLNFSCGVTVMVGQQVQEGAEQVDTSCPCELYPTAGILELPSHDKSFELKDLEIQYFEDSKSVLWMRGNALHFLAFDDEDDFMKFQWTCKIASYAAKNKIPYAKVEKDQELCAEISGALFKDADVEMENMSGDVVEYAKVEDMEMETSKWEAGNPLTAVLAGNNVAVFTPKGEGLKLATELDLKDYTPRKLQFTGTEGDVLFCGDHKDDTPRVIEEYNVEYGKKKGSYKLSRNGDADVCEPLTLMCRVEKKNVGNDANSQYILTGNRHRLVLLDKRASLEKMALRQAGKLEGPAPKGQGFVCCATDADGNILVATEYGEIRCYQSLLVNDSQKQARTTIKTLVNITHLDMTHDGQWAVATSDSQLLLFPTNKGTVNSIFEHGKKVKPQLIVVQLKAKDIKDQFKANGECRFTSAYFGTLPGDLGMEDHIITSFGKLIVLFNLRSCQKPKSQISYKLKSCDQKNIACAEEVMGSERKVDVIALQEDFIVRTHF